MTPRFPCDGSPGLGTRSVRVGLLAGIGLALRTEAVAATAAFATRNGASVWWGAAGTLLAAGLGWAWWRERRARRVVETKLGSVNERFRALFDESPLSICVFDLNDREIPFRIVECNQYACDLHGRTREELIGRGMEVLTPLRPTYQNAQTMLAQLRQGACRGENPHRKKDGSVFYIEYVARLVVIDGHEYMIGVDRDLSVERARRASEERLHRTAELNQLVLRASNDGIWDWDIVAGRITFSERSREMLGYTAEELPDHADWNVLIHPDDRKEQAEIRRRHWEEGAPYVFQYRAKHKNGSWRWIISRGITLFDEHGKPVRMVGCRTDVTELKRIDAELLQSRKLRAVGEMVGGIAHEFNNLLTPMLLHAEMLEMDNRGVPRVANHVAPIRTGIDRAKELTQRILAFGRRTVDACECVKLDAVVRDNIRFLSQTIDRRIRIVVLPSETQAELFANRSDLNQLVINLVLNARDTLLDKAASAPCATWEPRIEISWDSVVRVSGAPGNHTAARPWHRLTVQDNGQGMSEEVRERVFEPFFTTKEVGRGTGLGLATVWHVGAALGGWIEIESRQGEGTAFHVFMPPASGEANRPTTGEAQLTAAASIADTLAENFDEASSASERVPGFRVLLVEDSELVADATRRMIESFGCTVDRAADGLAAWAKLSGRPTDYDMVFTDLNLPGITGVELVRRLNGSGYGGRVVVYSGYFSREHRAALGGLRIEKLLAKPFSRAQLGEVLKSVPEVGEDRSSRVQA